MQQGIKKEARKFGSSYGFPIGGNNPTAHDAIYEYSEQQPYGLQAQGVVTRSDLLKQARVRS